MNNLARNIIIWLIFGAALMGLFNMFRSPSTGTQSDAVAYYDFMGQVKLNQIEEGTVEQQGCGGSCVRSSESESELIISVSYTHLRAHET